MANAWIVQGCLRKAGCVRQSFVLQNCHALTYTQINRGGKFIVKKYRQNCIHAPSVLIQKERRYQRPTVQQEEMPITVSFLQDGRLYARQRAKAILA